MKPKILIVATSRWFSTARLAMALADAGCTIEGVCPSRHPLGKTSIVNRIHPYYGLSPVESLTNAIAAAKPDLIVPADDLAARHLHELHRHARHFGREGAHTRALIEKSLGAPESFPVLYERARFIDQARQEGILVPETEVIRDLDALRDYTDRIGFPVVLKANGTSGGEGVRVVRTMEEAERAFRALQAPPGMTRALKRAVVDLDTRLIRPVVLRRRFVVNAQAFVAGRDATSLVACWKGAVLGGLHFEVLNKQYTDGPASVLRRIENAEMAAAAEKMVRRLKLSGLYGFDFMIEAQTGNPYLIEINPRTTQVAHLTFGPGGDLPAALYAVASGARIQESPVITDNPTIALFPQEWARNPASAFLQSGYHDIPWSEPELIRACVRKTRTWSNWNPHKKWVQVFSEERLPRP